MPYLMLQCLAVDNGLKRMLEVISSFLIYKKIKLMQPNRSGHDQLIGILSIISTD